ncbi:MAG: ComF family protein [bacterium]
MKIKLYFKNIKEFILDLFFPKKCLGCGQDDSPACLPAGMAGGWLCPDCFQKIKIAGRLLPNYDYLDGVWVSADYGDRILRQLIHSFKYQYVTELALVLAEMMVSALPLQTENWFIVPIPLHRRRLLERSFNQAELLAKEIGQRKNWPVLTDILYRSRHVKPQVKLKREERLVNIKGAFACRPNVDLIGKNILLVDDVMTTGATLSECAKVLKQNGANLVRGLVVAHG